MSIPRMGNRMMGNLAAQSGTVWNVNKKCGKVRRIPVARMTHDTPIRF
jgi:hypothetical protein